MNEDLNDLLEAHNEVARLERLAHHMHRIREAVVEIRAEGKETRESMKTMQVAIQEMAINISRLALVEERQSQDRSSIERAFNHVNELAQKHDKAIDRVMTVVERLDERLRVLETAQPMTKRTVDWTERAVWGIVTAAAIFIAAKVGLKP